jgi:hypothetical protein
MSDLYRSGHLSRPVITARRGDEGPPGAEHRAPARTSSALLWLSSVLLPATLLLPSVAAAQDPAADPAPCRTREEARQLDFWIGHWVVYNPETSQRVGENVIEPLLGDCALLENWTGAGGSSGKSLNFWDPQRRTWRQVWVSDRGNVLDYRTGEYRDGAMRFRGITIDEAGDTTLQRLTFHDVAPDIVRQVMEASTDGGETWETTWAGIYVRQEEGSPDGHERAVPDRDGPADRRLEVRQRAGPSDGGDALPVCDHP